MVEIQKLKSNETFATLDDETVAWVAQQASVVELSEGQTLFSRGDTPDAAFLLMHGSILVEVYSSEGRALRLAGLQPGELFGELAVLDGGSRTADARAKVDSTLYRFSRPVFQQLSKHQAAFSHALTLSVIGRLRATNEHVETVVWRTIRSRLASLLLALSNTQDEVAITQFELADELSVTREKVNVRLREFHRAGMIETGRGHIRIVDRQALLNCLDETDH